MLVCVLAGTTGGDPTIEITNRTVTNTAADPGTAVATYALNNNGSITFVTGGTQTTEWMLPNIAAYAARYEARATITGGTLTSGTTGSWINLGTTRTWARDRTGIGSNSCTFTLEIRDASSLQVLDSASITLTAEVIV